MRLFHWIIFCFLWLSTLWAQDPEILYLTWKGDPATTMTVMWQTENENNPDLVYFRRSNEENWKNQKGSSYRLKNSNVTIHQVELTNLVPDANYVFHIESGEIHKFRTMPSELSRPIHAVVAGDAYFSKELYQKMNREIASRDPDFVIMGGDIAYTEGLRRALRTRTWKIKRWQEFFRVWFQDMVTSDGRLIPILPVLGNHDVKEGFDNPYKNEVLFYSFFTFPNPKIPYWVFNIGKQLCFYLLDSGHTYPIGGRQTEWLKEAFEKYQGALYHIPVYHIAAYPSETAYTHRGSKDIRKFWVPLFEKYGVKISMEHDNHTFKRTFPLYQGMIDANGIYYLGDGSWGVYPDKPHRHWYLAKTSRINCYWLLTINREKILAEAFDNEGELIDRLDVFSPKG